MITKVLRTIRYYQREQLFWYVYYRLRRLIPTRLWFQRASLPELKIDKKHLSRYVKYAQNWADVEDSLASEAKSILEGNWKYAGETVPIKILLERDDKTLSPLAMYGFHSFEFLWTLCLAQLQKPEREYATFAENIVKQWIKRYPVGTSVAWDPYPTSYRIRYWILAMQLWQWKDDEILNSLAIQTKYLSRSLEYHLKANHLIQNLCGLIISSATLFPSELSGFLLLLEKELEEQILEDGGHYERVPMYHLHVFLDLLAVMGVLKEPPEFLKNALSKMYAYLEKITLSDSDIPLFGDSVHGHLPTSEKALQVGGKYLPVSGNTHESCISLPQSGYYIYKNEKEPCFNLIVRAGESGPHFQLAHSHCDQLSYELLFGQRRLIVDSGMHGYAGSPYRIFQRSTRAHNTVYIEGEEQLECWSTFRVARRGKALWTVWEPYEDGQLFAGAFQYYTGSIHTRAMYLLPDKGLLCWDWIETQKEKNIYNLIHLHPNMQVEMTNFSILLQCDRIKISVCPVDNEFLEIITGSSQPQQGWYSECFGSVIPNPVIVLKKKSTAKTLTKYGYWISFSDDETQFPKGTIQQWVENIEKKMLNKK